MIEKIENGIKVISIILAVAKIIIKATIKKKRNKEILLLLIAVVEKFIEDNRDEIITRIGLILAENGELSEEHFKIKGV